MKNKKKIHPASVFFILTIAVILLSWLGDIYHWEGVRNLLSAEGIRWGLKNVTHSFLTMPFLGNIIFLFFGGGLLVHSGWRKTASKLLFQRQTVSRREKNAWLISSLTGGGIFMLWCILAWGPWNELRSITGEFLYSPLWEGSIFLFALGLGVMGGVYGVAVDFYHTDKDFIAGMAYGFSQLPDFLVTLFFLGQFLSALTYANLLQHFALSPDIIHFAYIFFILLSFGFAIEKKHVSL